MSQRSRRYSWTLHGLTGAPKEDLPPIPWDPTEMTFLIYGR